MDWGLIKFMLAVVLTLWLLLILYLVTQLVFVDGILTQKIGDITFWKALIIGWVAASARVKLNIGK